MAKKIWTRDELLLAFNLYCKIPFGKIHIRNPQIIALAEILQRTPSAISWKLANFASLDTSLKKRNIKGAEHGAKADVQIWNEFHGNWDKLAFESERLLGDRAGLQLTISSQTPPPGLTREALVKVRVNQSFFRAAVLAAYDSSCCISGLNIPTLLIASHILPWALDCKNRTNPRNGLCLSAIHDRAFDCGLITVTPDYQVKASSLLQKKPIPSVEMMFLKYDGARIKLPGKFPPDQNFLRYHFENIFQP